jgi:hypothetical protein
MICWREQVIDNEYVPRGRATPQMYGDLPQCRFGILANNLSDLSQLSFSHGDSHCAWLQSVVTKTPTFCRGTLGSR